MSEATKQPVVSGSQVLAAGLASAMAAILTSRFGVAGTLLGAAVTSMIITGGSAILKSYLESVTGTVRKVPRKVRARANRAQAGRADAPAPPDTIPGRPDLRENFMGRMRAAMSWFSHLPTLRRRSIMVRGLVAALVAFVIGMGVVTAAEKGILGDSLSCGLWSECPDMTSTTSAPSTATGGTSTLGSILGSGGATQDTAPPTDQQNLQQDPNAQPQPSDPVAQPSDPAAEEPVAPETPAETPVEEPAVEPETPATPSETPETPAPSGAEEAAPVE